MSQAIGTTSLAYARVWHEVNLRGKVLGRVAPEIAKLLMGKNKPIYDPAANCGDFVVVTNAAHVMVTGNKAQQKLYRYHTGHPGGLREIPFDKMLASKPEQVIRHAVSGMLPKNKIRNDRLSRLLIFPGKEHPYKANIKKSYVQPAAYAPALDLAADPSLRV
ncbi:54S ribosomal protein L23, mitochondrial [Blastocladiella emersonii ATCC 22665]|nr:54S ribosomal protein L23, mitochondrial [Blastocladiella emersonii ATCC 22665]